MLLELDLGVFQFARREREHMEWLCDRKGSNLGTDLFGEKAEHHLRSIEATIPDHLIPCLPVLASGILTAIALSSSRHSEHCQWTIYHLPIPRGGPFAAKPRWWLPCAVE